MSVLQTQFRKKDIPRNPGPDVVLTNGGTKDFVTPLGSVIGPAKTATISQFELAQIPAATLSSYSITVTGGGVVVYGAAINEGTTNTNLTLGISAGEIRKSNGAYYTQALVADTACTIGAAPSAGNKRIDLVSFKESDNTIVVTAGTVVANAATAAAPATPTGNIPLANVAVASSVTAIANAAITDVRPRP